MYTSETLAEIDAALTTRQRSADVLNREPPQASWIGTALRYAGGASLFTASVVLLLQRYEGSDHVMQYLTFLVLTIVTGGAGLICGLRIGESKGARLLLSFVAGMAAIHASQLGALLYSVYGTPLASYPSLLLWQAHSAAAAWACVGIGAAAMIPMIALAYAVLDRQSARVATCASVLLNGSVLLPFRDPEIIAAVLIGQATLCTGIFSWSIGRGTALTKERFIVGLTLILPVFLTVGRQLMLYSTTPLFMSALLATIAFILITIAPVRRLPKSAVFLELAALGNLFVAWFIALDTWGFFDGSSPPAFSLTVVLPVAAVAAMISFRNHNGAGLFDSLAAILVIGAVCSDLLRDINVWSTGFHVIASVLVLTWACLNERKFLLAIGIVGFGIGMGQHVLNALTHLTVNPWVLLGSAGIGTIVLGSYLEKNAERIRMHAGLWRRSFRGWSM